MKYMLMMHGTRGNGDWNVASWSPDDLKAHIGFMKRFAGELAGSGELVAAEGLAAPEQARVVRAGRTGAPEVTDGPFAESKEFLAGFWVVECPGIERACEIAAHISTAPGAGGAPMNFPVEVRPIGTAPDLDEEDTR